jgi:hypothetical protein
MVLLLAALLVAVTGRTASAALPPACGNTSDDNLYRWVGGSGNNWSNPANWAHGPGNTAGVPTASAVACIGSTFVFVDTTVNVQALHLGGTAVTVDPGQALFTNGPAASVWDSDSLVVINQGTFGGTGSIEMGATLNVHGPASLASLPGAPGTACGTAGRLTVMSGAYLIIEDGSLSLRTCFQLGISGQLWVQNNGFVTADWGTSTTVNPGGILDFQNNGGYYQGSPVAGRSLGSFVNGGSVLKSGGPQTSVVDAAYSQTGTGTVIFSSGTDLALPGTAAVAGSVAAGATLGTAACGTSTTTVCSGSASPAVDIMSVTFQVPPSNPGNALVQLQELTEPPDTTDSRAIGNDVFAHADQLQPAPGDFATIRLRYSQPDVMATPLDQVQVAHISDAGVMTQTPDCVGAVTLPSGAPYCVVRPVTRDAQNTFVTVLTTQTSRWRLRRTAPGETFGQTPPAAPAGLAAGRGAPGDGSVVHLAWTAPASDGGAAVTSYRVLLDGVQVGTTSSTSYDVRDAGPGTHALAVAAVNLIGTGGQATAPIVLPKASSPRKARALQGPQGGKRTAGVKWRAPASSGGLTILKYQVQVLPKVGKASKKSVGASKHRLMLKLGNGRYQFRVRARTADGWGPWSKKTDAVRPR